MCRPHAHPHRAPGAPERHRSPHSSGPFGPAMPTGDGISSRASRPELVGTWRNHHPSEAVMRRRALLAVVALAATGVLAPVLPVDAQPVPVTPSTVTVPIP